ncbi:LptF/LptG family permease [Fervidobacterium islandicum]|nr:LptF/LptG family permease [Fervidobacterium islandicum]
MKTLTKYVLKQSLKPFFMGLAGFIVFVSVEWLYQISDYIIRNRVGFSKLLLFVAYNIPYFTVLGIPVGVLFAIFWVTSEMSTNREITAILVHGISSKRLVTPFLILALILGFFAWLLNDYVVPNANYKSSQVLNQYILQSPETVIKTNMLVELEKDVYFYVKQYDKQKGELYDVVLFRNEEGNEQIVTSKKVMKRQDGWYLLDGNMYVVELETGFLKLDMQFREMKLDVAGEIEQMLRAYKTTRDKTSKELREQLETYKKLGINTASLTVELHQRYANALGSLVIVLIGLPISLLFGLTSKSWGVILTFVLVVLYQGSGAWLSGMGKEGLMDPVLATWLPNLVFAVVGFLLYLFMDTPVAYRAREVLSRFFTMLLVVISLSLIFSSVGFAADLKVNANIADFSENLVSLKNGITMTWDKYKLECDEASATLEDGKVKTVYAVGNVSFYDGDRKYFAKSLVYYFETSRVLVLNAKTVYNYNYKGKNVPIYVHGSEIEVENITDEAKMLVEIRNPAITTCNFEEPHYTIQSEEVYVLENKYIIATNSFLVVLGVPVFPYPVFVTALQGESPYSLTFTFGQTLGVSQTFAFTLNNWSTKLTLGTDNVTFQANDSVNKQQRVSFDMKSNKFEFTIFPLTYRYVNNAVYYKYDGVLYFEGNYLADSNYYQKVGLTYQDPKSPFYFKPYIMYDGRLTDTIVYLNGGFRNLSFVLLNSNNLTLNLDDTVQLRTDGYLTSLERDWTSTYRTTYTLTLSNNNIRYNFSLTGNLSESAQNRTFTYTYQFPWTFKWDAFTLNFNYTFNIKGVSNIAATKTESVGMSDKYISDLSYILGPFRLTGGWEQFYGFLDEPAANNKNVLRFTFSLSSDKITASASRGIDISNNKLLPDSYSIRYSEQFGPVGVSNSISGTYDNDKAKLGVQNFNLGLNFQDIGTSYSLQFSTIPGNQISTYIHTLKYANLSATIYQKPDYIERATVSGSFNLFDYLAKLSGTYYVRSANAEPTWSLSYSMEKKDEKYVVSYNTDNTRKYLVEISNKTIDPNVYVKLKYDPSRNLLESVNLTFDKSLHCWRLLIGADLSYKATGNWLDYLDKLTLKFYLTDISDIFFLLDPKAGQFQFSGM